MTGVPDLKYIIERMVVAEDYVAIQLNMTGTHTVLKEQKSLLSVVSYGSG